MSARELPAGGVLLLGILCLGTTAAVAQQREHSRGWGDLVRELSPGRGVRLELESGGALVGGLSGAALGTAYAASSEAGFFGSGELGTIGWLSTILGGLWGTFAGVLIGSGIAAYDHYDPGAATSAP